MDDMNAFERQVADEVIRSATPARPVDATAVFAAIPTATQSPKWRFQSMSSATKFVVAGAIVALVGGFLLAGVLTQPSDEPLPAAAASASASPEAEASDQSVRSDLLPGVDLITEEIAPGAHRVISDGVRELTGLPADEERYLGGVMDTNIAAGLDGSIWLFGLDGFFRLGADATHDWPENPWRQAHLVRADIEVGPEGSIWLQSWPPLRGSALVNNGDIWSFDDESWTRRRQGDKDELLRGVAVQEDGTVWTTRATNPPSGKNKPEPRVTVARLGADGWEDLPGSVEGTDTADVIVAAGGGEDVWLMAWEKRLRRHDGTGWAVQPTPKAGGEARAAVGPDGTLWVRLVPCGSTKGCGGQPDPIGRSAILARFDGEAWEVFRAKDGIPRMGDHYQGFEGFFEVAPDRSIWFNPNGDRPTESECDGIASFDGQILHHYLRGHCITAMDIAPDGTVWLRATERMPDGSRTPESPSRTMWLPNEPVHTYAITRESSTATES